MSASAISLTSADTPFIRRGRGNPNPTGRLPRGERRSVTDIKHLQQIHHEVLNMTAIGMKPGEIAKTLNVSKAMIDYTVNGTLGQEKLALLRGARDADTVDLAEEIRAAIPEAIKRVKQVIADQTASDADALRACFGMMDRCPETSPAKRIQTQNQNLHFTPKDVAELRGEAFSDVIKEEINED